MSNEQQVLMGRGEKPKRDRTDFTPAQVKRLESEFLKNNFMSKKEEREKLAKELGLTEKNVRFWFYNRRMKLKNEQETLGQVQIALPSAKRPREHDTLTEDLPNQHVEGCLELQQNEGNGGPNVLNPVIIEVESPAERKAPVKRKRTDYTPEQVQRFESLFLQNNFMKKKDREKLAAEMGLTESNVRLWFNNRRMKLKKEQERSKNEALRNAFDEVLPPAKRHATEADLQTQLPTKNKCIIRENIQLEPPLNTTLIPDIPREHDKMIEDNLIHINEDNWEPKFNLDNMVASLDASTDN
jgi:hypothetical protein